MTSTEIMKRWKDLHKIQSRWHANTLSVYISYKMIPKDLHVQRAPSGVDKESFMRYWKRVLNRCSSALMANAMQYMDKDECMLQWS